MSKSRYEVCPKYRGWTNRATWYVSTLLAPLTGTDIERLIEESRGISGTCNLYSLSKNLKRQVFRYVFRQTSAPHSIWVFAKEGFEDVNWYELATFLYQNYLSPKAEDACVALA